MKLRLEQVWVILGVPALVFLFIGIPLRMLDARFDTFEVRFGAAFLVSLALAWRADRQNRRAIVSEAEQRNNTKAR
jgi:hypothetical protein